MPWRLGQEALASQMSASSSVANEADNLHYMNIQLGKYKLIFFKFLTIKVCYSNINDNITNSWNSIPIRVNRFTISDTVISNDTCSQLC